ncbi:MAG TPA: DNA mismatch repair endonuclease MutL [Bacteroidales bacterium]|nr:MAG: DNA mismatch repair protein MutL [Bacteroidetes bacterium GWF2_33_38]HBF86993.1 DNA mismatch repair endonuclease MutL [Bacteroidales bacterium]
MPDIINLLPDSVANQIAAGEVIQRPASIIKEMVENSLDAGATNIQVNVKDSGRTLVQIIDNGKGMSETDARMAFERHATSKISSVDDIYSLTTMGFRGEALASIAAIAQVELRTKQNGQDLGTKIQISGSTVELQESCNCSVGSNFTIRNIFYNVPVRRKFLKANSTELKHIVTEFQKIALCNSSVAMSLYSNDTEIYVIPQSNIKQRIVNVFGKQISQNLIPLDTETSIVKISGFVGKPEFAKKTIGEQFFFINGRFMKSSAFHKAVLDAYDKILPYGTIPSYFIFLDVDPSTIDVNIHPTKTEIKFENAKAVWQMIFASIKEALGKHNIVPSLDFDQEAYIDIPYLNKESEIKKPHISVNQEYNPFKTDKNQNKSTYDNWDKLYSGFENKYQAVEQENIQQKIELENQNHQSNLYQYKSKYIFSAVKSGLMIIDQRRANERILFEQIMKGYENHVGISQKNLFPEQIVLTEIESMILTNLSEELEEIGFDISCIGNNTFAVNGTPAVIDNCNPQDVLQTIIANHQKNKADIKSEVFRNLAESLAKYAAMRENKKMSSIEVEQFINNLFSCQNSNYTPDGKAIITILNDDELDKKLK